jgi:prepilin peptidase CpaA
MLMLIFEAMFICCVVYAMITDVLYLKIQNWISMALLAAFALFAAYLAATQPALLFSAWDFTLQHVAVGLAVFAGAVFLYAIKWIGGGDTKLLGAVGLWAGPENGIEFLLFTAVFGIVLAVTILAARSALRFLPALSAPGAANRLFDWARAGVCPYGLAIGASALCVVPKIFG